MYTRARVTPTPPPPQMIGQIIGEVLKQLDENRFIVKVRAYV
jgi:hypothetical protein